MEFDLVFEGGGAKGHAFVGALRAFERHGHRPRRVIGTSAGSIVAVMVASGYDANEAEQANSEKLPDGRSRYSSFLDVPVFDADSEIHGSLRYWLKTELDNPLVPNLIEPMVDNMVENLMERDSVKHLLSLLIYGGWFGGNNFMKWLSERLDQNGRALSGKSLREFQANTSRELSMVASDLSGKQMLVLNHRTAPDCPVNWAVRMSMGCPFAWPEVIWKEEWGKYRGQNITGHKIVDGGLLSNFPIGLLVGQDENIDEIMGEDSASPNVIGMLIDETLPVPGAEEPPERPITAPGMIERFDFIQDMLWRVRGMAETVVGGHDKTIIEAYKEMVVRLPAKGYSTLDFDMNTQREQSIIKAGEEAMDAYLTQRGL